MNSYRTPHIALTVDNIDETKNFYTSLGFTIAEDMYSEDKKRHFLLLHGYGLEIEVFHFDNQAKNQRIQAENLEEVGGKVTDADGKPWFLGIDTLIAARNEKDYQYLKNLYQKTLFSPNL